MSSKRSKILDIDSDFEDDYSYSKKRKVISSYLKAEVVSESDIQWNTEETIPHINSAERFMLFKLTMDKLGLRNKLKSVLNTTTQKFTDTKKNSKECLISMLKDTDEYKNVRISLTAEVTNAIRIGYTFEIVEKKQVSKIKAEYAIRWKELFPDYRMYVPADRGKVAGHWLAAFLSNVCPDTNMDGWQKFQCSHLCGQGNCLNPDHLVWESASINQSRGNSTCRMLCRHSNCTTGHNICRCNGIHQPPCI